MENLKQAIRDTDWELLAQQKLALLRITSWIDAVQDAIVADGIDCGDKRQNVRTK